MASPDRAPNAESATSQESADEVYIVFSQEGGLEDAIPRVRASSLLAQPPSVQARDGRLFLGAFELGSRPATEADWLRADAAELRGRAAGMAQLARRCPLAWEVHVAGATAPEELWPLLAALASAALGPILPPDGSTLYGIRSALAQAERH